MITVISPAKKLTKECKAQTKEYLVPRFLNKTESLINTLKLMKPHDLMTLMGISEKLAVLNWERIQNWTKKIGPENSLESIYMFRGDTYSGLDADSLNDDDINFAQDNTRILSGLYGLLRPLDMMMPYRLEMGTKLKHSSGNNLYDYWGDTLAFSINEDLKKHSDNIIINCASVEYFKAIDRPSLNAKIITPSFKEIKNGKMRMVSFHAKRARGMMTRFIIQNKIRDHKDILSFNLGGYRYEKSISLPFEPTFVRAQA